MTFIEWIEATGNQYIETGISPTENTIVEIYNLTPVTQSRYGAFLGEGNQSGRIYSIRFNGTNNNLQFQMGADNAAINAVGSAVGNTYYVKAEKNKFTLNDQEYTGNNQSLSNPVTTLKIFANGSGENGKGKIKEVKIYNGTTLQADFVAALNDSDVPGMYDTVSGNFYTNAGSGAFNAGPEIQHVYTVIYNANGGTGTMPDQEIEVDTQTALNQCTYTRTDYIFTGWATTPGGTVVYQDEEIVYNIAEENESITLYAVWQVAPFSIILQHNKSENNKVTKDIDTIATYGGVLKAETSIINPIFIVECDLTAVIECNYITIPKFKRSYFVNNISSFTNNLVAFSCHVDVISSFAEEIKANKGIVRRAERENAFNLNINDGSLVAYQDPYILTEPFPNGFTGAGFILSVAGG